MIKRAIDVSDKNRVFFFGLERDGGGGDGGGDGGGGGGRGSWQNVLPVIVHEEIIAGSVYDADGLLRHVEGLGISFLVQFLEQGEPEPFWVFEEEVLQTLGDFTFHMVIC